jgi:hypothetical protein
MEKRMKEKNVWDSDVACELEGPPVQRNKKEIEETLNQRVWACGQNLINSVMWSGQIPDDWKKSVFFPVHEDKGDPLLCGS